MSINAADVERVLLAIADVATPPATRTEYNKAIEELKEGSGEQLLQLSLQLASSQNPYIAHVALNNFVQHAIKFKWNSLDVQTRISLKDEIMRRMQIGPPPSPLIAGQPVCSPSQWAEPLARCVTAMAEHEWPQHWTELGEKLRTMAIQAATPATSIAVLCVIRRLLEDVVVFANVANAKRRREMAAAIHDCMKPWLGMCIQLFADARQDSEESLLVVKHVIGLLSIMVESATTPDMEPLIDEMVNHLVRFLSTASHSIYEEAALCLTGIASRKKTGVAEKVVVDTFFRDNVIKSLLETASLAAHVAHSNEEHYKYLKALCDTLTTVGLHLASVWTATAERTCKSPPPPANFGLYMSALSEFALHPALWLRSEATNVLIRFASSPHIRKWKELRATLRDKILPRLVDLVERTGMPSSSVISDAVHYARMDYDDDVEWAHDFTQYRTRIFNLVRETMDDHHEVLLAMVEQRILQRVALDPNSVHLHEWDGLHKLSKTVLGLAFEKQFIENKRMDETTFTNAYNMIIQTIGTKASFATANEALSVLASLYPLIDRQPQLVEPLLALLERLSLSCASECAKELKRHLTSTLISIVTKHEKVAKEYWRRIFEVTNRMAESASLMQSSQIANAIAALSNVVDSEDDKKQLLEIALAPQLQRLQQMQGLFTSAHSFLEATGFLVTPPSNIEESERHEGVRNRKLLRSTLCAIEGIVQKVDGDSPIGPILVPQCEAFARLVRILFELYDPTTLTVVHGAYAGLLQIPYGERQSIYCTVGENLEAATGNRPRHNEDARGSIALAIQFLSEINDTLQSIISICAGKFSPIFYSLPALPTILSDCTANLERLPDFRVRYWLKKAWPTLLVCAPPSALPAIFPLLSTIVEHCQRRLERVWAQVSTIDYDSEPTEEELFLEHMTCVLSRELVGFLKAVFVHEEKHTTSNTGNAAAISVSLSPLGCAVFNAGGQLFSSFVTLTFSALAWRDTQSCVRAIPVAKAIVDKLAEFFIEEAAVFAMANVLQSIRIHGSDEVAIGPLLTIIFHTYAALRPHSLALRHLLEQLPDTPPATIEAFDKRAIAISRGLEEMPEKARKDMVRKLLRPIISVTLGELGRRPVELRPLPPIEKRAKPAEEEPDYGAVGDFFGH